jgi:DNA mismatch repair endonuclease MutH
MSAPESDELRALLAHARALVGVELGELADALGLPVPVGRVRTKGWSGQVIEHELGVAVGGTRGPDFAALGIELKTVPVTEALEPLESTAVCQIDPIAIAGESWESSYVRAKLARVLFVALAVPPGASSVGERQVAAVRLWSPNVAEDAALRADFELFARDRDRIDLADRRRLQRYERRRDRHRLELDAQRREVGSVGAAGLHAELVLDHLARPALGAHVPDRHRQAQRVGERAQLDADQRARVREQRLEIHRCLI